MYEEGTTLYRMLERGKIEEIDEETSRQMYELLITQLTSAGYEHYEISNFAKPGYRSRHNSSYWHEVPYIGIGAAAHSYRRETKRGEENKIEATRSWNVDNIREYIASIQRENCLVKPNPWIFLQDTMTLSPRHYGQAMVLI